MKSNKNGGMERCSVLPKCINPVMFHNLAMLFMLCDHIWGTLSPGWEWLTCIGRVSFPLFAFMAAEGIRKTKDRKKYACRLLLTALISEIPFDMMCNGVIFYPYHQNVLWTFLLSFCVIEMIKKCRQSSVKLISETFPVIIVFTGYLAGYLFMTDYYGMGVLMVIMFYYLHGNSLKVKLFQIICMYILNVTMLGGYYYEVVLFGVHMKIVQQGLAIFSLILIWMYDENRTPGSKYFRYFCYGFYPAHMLILSVIRNIIL